MLIVRTKILYIKRNNLHSTKTKTCWETNKKKNRRVIPEIQNDNKDWALGRQNRARKEDNGEFMVLEHKDISAVPSEASVP